MHVIVASNVDSEMQTKDNESFVLNNAHYSAFKLYPKISQSHYMQALRIYNR